MKTRMVTVRFSEEDYECLSRSADNKGVGIGEYIRSRVGCTAKVPNGRPVKTVVLPVEPTLDYTDSQIDPSEIETPF